MPKFVIERDIPGAGNMSPADLKKISQKSCGVLSSLGPSVQWIQSFVTADRIYCIYHATDESLVRRHAELGGFPADRIYCIYHATDESLVRRHAELGGFPANRISRVATVIDPATAE